MHKIIALKEVEIELVGAESIGVARVARHIHSYLPKQLDEVVDISDVGDITDGHRLRSEQRGTDDLQCLVLGTLGSDGALERMTAFNDK